MLFRYSRKQNEAKKAGEAIVSAEDKEDVEKRLVQTLKMGISARSPGGDIEEEAAACNALPKDLSDIIEKVKAKYTKKYIKLEMPQAKIDEETKFLTENMTQMKNDLETKLKTVNPESTKVVKLVLKIEETLEQMREKEHTKNEEDLKSKALTVSRE